MKIKNKKIYLFSLIIIFTILLFPKTILAECTPAGIDLHIGRCTSNPCCEGLKCSESYELIDEFGHRRWQYTCREEKKGKEEMVPVEVDPSLQIPIPGFGGFSSVTEPKIKEGGKNYYYIPWIAEYIGALYKFGVGAAAVLSVIVIMVGGFIWLTAGGNQERVTAAKGYITGALIGLVVALGSYSVLKVVNPSLVYLKPLKILVVERDPFEPAEGEISEKKPSNLDKVEYIVIHCTASAFGNVATIDKWHKERGWSGIGYHYLILNGYQKKDDLYNISWDGAVKNGRSTNKTGAHAKGYNNRSIGIAFVDICDGMKSIDARMTPQQQESLIKIVSELKDKYDVSINHIIGHNETGSGKTCPGFNVAELRQLLLQGS